MPEGGISLQAPQGPTAEQFFFAAFVLAALFAILVLFKHRIRWAGLPDDQKEHAQYLFGQLADQTPTSITFTRDEIQSATGRVRADVETAVRDHDADVSDDGSWRSALSELRTAWGEGVQPITDRFPRLASRIALLGGLDLVLGALAVVSLETWRDATKGSLDTKSPMEVLNMAWGLTVDATTGAYDIGHGLLSSFPFAQTLWELAFTFALIGVTWIYEHPFATSTLLITLAIAIAVLDAQLEGDESELYPRDSHIVTGVLLGLTKIWLAGVGPAAVGRVVGLPEWGAYLGGFFALLATLKVLAGAVKRARFTVWRHLRGTYRNDPARTAGAYIVIRKAALAAAVLVSPVIGAYTITLIASGRLLELAYIFAAASLVYKVLAAYAVLGFIALTVKFGREAGPALHTALLDIVAEQSVRAYLFATAAPTFTLIIVFAVAVSMGMAPMLAFLTGFSFALLQRLLWNQLARLRHRAALIDMPLYKPPWVVFHVYRVRDADGDEHTVVEVNGKRHAHDSDELLAEAATQTAVELTRDRRDHETPTEFRKRVTPKVAMIHATNLLDLGIVRLAAPSSEKEDAEAPSTENRLRTMTKRHVFGTLASNNARVTHQKMEDATDDLPDAFVDDKLHEFEYCPPREGQIIDTGSHYVLYR